MTGLSMMKLVTSALVLGTTMTAWSTSGMAEAPLAASDSRNAKAAVQAARGAAKAIGKRDHAAAIALAETAVGHAPRDAGYRMLLGQAYLGAGRFASAEASFTDTLTLDPERSRAALNLGLSQAALGKRSAASATLADYRDRLSPADYGLATALSGDVEAAIGVLEAAVRAPGANAKTRQNLALAYALAGRWSAARVMADQDLAPADAGARILEWARLASTSNSSQQVAAVLGVTPVADEGQPQRLALNPGAAPVAVAASEPTPPARAPDAAFVEALPPVSDTPVETAAVFETAAPPAVVAPVAAPLIMADAQPARRPLVLKVRAVRPQPRGVEQGRYVVQLGAFSTMAVAERAWTRVASRYRLGDYTPANGTARRQNVSLVRLSIGGFNTRGDADRACARIKRSGGVCFVRSATGDAPAQWVQRRGGPRLASR